MSAEIPNVRQVRGYCSLCIARCGTVATVTDGRFTRLDPDPTHPTGAAICAKGRAAPELVYHKDRLKRPLRRTRPKGDVDPGWEEISWDAAPDERFRHAQPGIAPGPVRLGTWFCDALCLRRRQRCDRKRWRRDGGHW